MKSSRCGEPCRVPGNARYDRQVRHLVLSIKIFRFTYLRSRSTMTIDLTLQWNETWKMFKLNGRLKRTNTILSPIAHPHLWPRTFCIFCLDYHQLEASLRYTCHTWFYINKRVNNSRIKYLKQVIIAFGIIFVPIFRIFWGKKYKNCKLETWYIYCLIFEYLLQILYYIFLQILEDIFW